MPETIRFDHGPEFTSILMLRWGAEHRLRLHFIDHSKPARNGQVESFNGRVRDELLNPNCFANVHEARSATEDGLIDYNELRPHSALGYRTPQEFITAFQQSTHQYPRRISGLRSDLSLYAAEYATLSKVFTTARARRSAREKRRAAGRSADNRRIGLALIFGIAYRLHKA